MASGSQAFHEYQSRLQQSLHAFEEFFQSQVKGFEPELREVVQAVLGHPGKRLRPLFVFACAGMLQQPTLQALRMASIVELIHLATLVHDDILDDAHTRHSQPAHHRLYNPKISVLTGDTLFLHANELAAQEEDVWVGRVVAAAAKATCTGEIAQGLRTSPGQPLGFDEYIRQIQLKTGKLFGLACALGGYLAQASHAERAQLARYGECFGTAYQLYDDAADIWGSETDFKKTLGTDQLQHKWTMPWILLHQAQPQLPLAPLWASRPLALKSFQSHGVWAGAEEVFDGYLQEARLALQGSPQAGLLLLPLEFVKAAWQKLTPLPQAVNE